MPTPGGRSTPSFKRILLSDHQRAFRGTPRAACYISRHGEIIHVSLWPHRCCVCPRCWPVVRMHLVSMSHYIDAMAWSPISHYISSGLLYSAQVFHLRAALSSQLSYRLDPIRSFQQQNNYVKREAQLCHLSKAAQYFKV